MNIEITTEALLDAAKQIDTIVSNMKSAMDDLDNIINNKLGPVGSGKPVSTNWAEQIVSNWKRYYTNDIPATMEQMQQSAVNLRMAVDSAISYSNGN